MTEEQAVERLWNWHHLGQAPRPAQVIWGFGCHDEQVARHAAALYAQGYGQRVLFTGGLGHVTRDIFRQPEAERFAALAQENGVPAEALLLDCKSTNTGENIVNAKALLAAAGLAGATVLAVDKPTRERRTWATLKKQWPELEFTITSPPVTLVRQRQRYQSGQGGISWTQLVALMVGDTQRMELYAQKGFQIPDPLPAEVRAAMETLIAAGYTRYLA